MNGRDAQGKFVAGNQLSSAGGRRRMERLTPEQRRALAKAGFQALCEQRFDGNVKRCHAWLFDPLGYRSGPEHER